MEVKRKNSKKRAAILDALASVTEHPTAEMLYLCFTASWTAQMLSLFCIFLFALHRYRTGRLVKI